MVPAVVLVLAIALAALQLTGEQVRLQAAVAQAARSVGRGETGSDPVREVSPGAAVAESQRGDLLCVTATVPATLGILVGIRLSATSCALGDGL